MSEIKVQKHQWVKVVLVVTYVSAAVAANLVVAAFGPSVVPFVSFVLVGFVMTARDRLHDAWRGRHLTARMGLLVVVGSALSYAVNADAARIALASAVAFGASESVNALVYHPLLVRGVAWLKRVNLGNFPNATVDSLLFVTIAFGFAPWIIAAQIGAKVAGGGLWSLVLARRKEQTRGARHPVLSRDA